MAKTIQQIKKENPYYENVPDLQLADALYNKFYKGKIDESSFFSQAFPEIKVKRGSEDIISPDDEFNQNYDFQSTPEKFRPTVSEIAEQAGVSVNDPATSKARFGGSLGYTPFQKNLAIKKTLSELYGQDIDIRIGSATGELEYYNPKTNRYALVDAPGADLGDLADLGGDAMVIVPDIVATIAGSRAGAVPGIAAGAAGAFGGEYAKLLLGQILYGINETKEDGSKFTQGDLATKAAKSAGISAVAGTAGLGLVKLAKGVVNIAKGRLVGDNADSVLEGVKDADMVAKQITDRLDAAKLKSKLKFTLAQSLDDADMLAAQQSFENTKRLGYMDQFRTFNRNQAEALNDYFGVLKSGFNTGGAGKPISEFDSGVMIQEVIKKRNTPRINEIIKKQEQSEKLLTKNIFNLPDGSVKVTGSEARSIIDDLGKTYKENVELAAKNLDKAVGVQSIKTDIIADSISKLSTKDKFNLLNIAKTEGIFKKEVFDYISKKDSSIPLQSARETIQALGKKIRDVQTGSVTGESVDVGKLKFLESAFKKQIKKNASKEYLNELENFNSLVVRNKKLLNNDTISKLTSIDSNGVLKIANEDVFAQTFKTGIGSGKVARETYDVISQSPDALSAYKNSIYGFYKNKVLENGVPNATKHNQFVKSYEQPLKTFFTKNEYDKISRIGGLKKYLDNITKTRKEMSDSLNKSFAGKLENSSPQEIYKKIYRPNNIGEIKKLKNILKNDPEVFKSFQRNVLTDLNERSVKSSDKLGVKIIDPKAFNNYLNGAGGERGYKNALQEIFGKDFVNDLNILNKALKIKSRVSPSTAAEGVYGNAFTDIIRARVGQFSPLGRLLTAGRRIYKKSAERIIANALLNPQSLRELMELRKLKPNTEKAAIILGKLGGSIFIVD